MPIRLLPSALVLLGCGARTELGVVHEGSDAAPASTACRVSGPTVLFSGGGNSASVVVDQNSVYWSSGDGVQAIDKSGANHRIIASQRKYPTGIAVAAGFVYWGEYYSGVIARAPVSGQGGLDVLCGSISGYPSDVTVLGGDVYWSNSLEGSVARLVGTSSPELIAAGDGSYTAITTDGHFVFFAAQSAPPYTGSIHRFDPATKASTKLADSLTGAPWSLATDGVNVYFNGVFAELGSATIVASVGENGGPMSVLAQVADKSAMCPPAGCLGAVDTDGRFVYFTSDESDGLVRKVPVSGGTPVVIADHQAQPYGIAVDDDCVYWSNYASGDIMAAPK